MDRRSGRKDIDAEEDGSGILALVVADNFSAASVTLALVGAESNI